MKELVGGIKYHGIRPGEDVVIDLEKRKQKQKEIQERRKRIKLKQKEKKIQEKKLRIERKKLEEGEKLKDDNEVQEKEIQLEKISKQLIQKMEDKKIMKGKKNPKILGIVVPKKKKKVVIKEEENISKKEEVNNIQEINIPKNEHIEIKKEEEIFENKNDSLGILGAIDESSEENNPLNQVNFLDGNIKDENSEEGSLFGVQEDSEGGFGNLLDMNIAGGDESGSIDQQIGFLDGALMVDGDNEGEGEDLGFDFLGAL